MQFNIHKLTETASTNDDARQAAEVGAAEGTVIWALSQSAGRGRQGRQWASAEGNLYCSIVLRPSIDTQNYGLYSFVAALAIFDIVRDILPNAQIDLKWPNDVLVGGKKISGLLLEVGAGFLIVGIGINVAHYPENPLYPTTSLSAETQNPPQLEVVLDRLLKALAYWDNVLRQGGFASIRAAWLDRARKGSMRVRLPNAEIHGEFADLDEQGNLHLLLGDGTTRKINAGDVFF